MREDGKFLSDEEGMELPDLATARQYAIFNARSIAAENVSKGRLDLSHHIEIADDRGQAVATVSFADVVKLET